MKFKIFLTSMLLCAAFVLIAQEARYEIKSAIISKTIEMMGQKIEGVQYVDDYGKKESVTINMPMQGVPGAFVRTRTINKIDTIYTINLDYKTGTKTAMPNAIDQINYLKITPEMREKQNIKELGKEEVAGKLCDKYSLEISQAGQKASATTWVWKGIVLKSVISVSGITMTEAATDIKENVAVDADNFNISNDIVFK